jgi:transposase
MCRCCCTSIFIAAFGVSSYTYAEARWSETLRDWIGASVNALDFFGGVPKATVPDSEPALRVKSPACWP